MILPFTSKSVATHFGSKKKALLVGASYKGTDALVGPEADAKELRDLLIDTYDYDPHDIVMMLDNGPETLVPTSDNIRLQMKNLVADARPGDRFLFHFSGHGGQTENLNYTETDGFDEVIEGVDGGSIIDDDIRHLLVDPLPGGSTLIAIFDSCHSGTMLDLEYYHKTAGSLSLRSNSSESDSSRGVSQAGSFTSTHTVMTTAISEDISDTAEGGPHVSAVAQSSISSTMSHNNEPTFRPRDKAHLEGPVQSAARPSRFPPDTDDKPHVYSLSASQDSAIVMEDSNGRTMTKALIDALRKDPHPELEELLFRIRDRLYTETAKWHKIAEWENDFQKFKADQRRSFGYELEDYPIPQLGSTEELHHVINTSFTF